MNDMPTEKETNNLDPTGLALDVENMGTKVSIERTHPEVLKTEAPFKDLFPVNPAMVSALAQSMEQEGFLPIYPVVVWNGVVVDGHTRLAAARQVGIGQIECAFMNFGNEEEALDFTIRAQRNRRNLTDADILRCIEVLDRKMTHSEAGKIGRDAQLGLAPDGASPVPGKASDKTATKTAKQLGTSPRKVERARAVHDHASEDLKQEVRAGKKTLNAAFNETQKQRKPKSENAANQSSTFEVELMKEFQAPDSKAAKESFFNWCRKAKKKEFLEVTICQKVTKEEGEQGTPPAGV